MTPFNDTANDPANDTALHQHGLNLAAVFNLSELPPQLLEQLDSGDIKSSDYTQLILVGHAGQTLWTQVQQWQADNHHSGNKGSENPVDDFSIAKTSQWLKQYLSEDDYVFVYPGPTSINLKALGELAGWHHESPMKIGIHQKWGTWYAYRALILANSQFAASELPVNEKQSSGSPCEQCIIAPCINACPVGAITGDALDLELCIDYRRSTGSDCINQCLGRQACHVGKAHQYSDEQIEYHYTCSFRTITGQN